MVSVCLLTVCLLMLLLCSCGCRCLAVCVEPFPGPSFSRGNQARLLYPVLQKLAAAIVAMSE